MFMKSPPCGRNWNLYPQYFKELLFNLGFYGLWTWWNWAALAFAFFSFFIFFPDHKKSRDTFCVSSLMLVTLSCAANRTVLSVCLLCDQISLEGCITVCVCACIGWLLSVQTVVVLCSCLLASSVIVNLSLSPSSLGLHHVRRTRPRKTHHHRHLLLSLPQVD